MINALRKQRRAPAIFTGAVLALLAIVVVILLQNMQQEETNSTRREFENFARVFDEHVTRIIKITDQSMMAMRASYEANPQRFSLSEWMSTNVVASDVLPQIAIVDRDGLVLTSSALVAGAAPVYVTDREHFLVHVDKTKDDLFISKPVLGRVSGKWTIQLTRMLRDPTGAFNGIIVFSLDTSYFSRFYDSISIGRSGQVLLVGSKDGVIRALATPENDQRSLGSDVSDRRLMTEILKNEAGSFVRQRVVDGRRTDTVYAYRLLKEYPLFVMLGADATDYMAPFMKKRPFIIFSALGVGCIILVMAVWLSIKMKHLQTLEMKSVMLQLAGADEKASARVREEEEQRYRAATDAASDAIISWRVEGKVIFANPSARNMFGLRDDEEIENAYTAFFPPAESERIHQNIEALQRRNRGLGMTLEAEALRKNGESFAVEISLNRWASGDGDSVTMIVRDISQRRRNEEEKKQLLTQAMTSQKMEAIGTMAGGIAHDFNNVLGAMQGFIWLAQQEVAAGSQAALLLDKATKSGDRAAQVVRQLMEFSRSGDADTTTMNLSNTIKELSDIAGASIPSTVTCTFESQPDLFLNGDATHVHQLLLNLLINAEHAVDHAGSGHIAMLAERALVREGHFGGPNTHDSDTLPLVKSQWEADGSGGKLWYGSLPPGDYVCVTVADNGHGMNSEVMHRAFEPFFTTKPVGEGTGLGLSVLLGIVKSMRGGIVLNSHVGKGTTFKLYFPYVSQMQASVVREELAPQIASEFNRKVLVVDDEENLRNVVASTLLSAGYSVEMAENGVEALRMVSENPQKWDLVLTDWAMPQMAGDKLALAVRGLRADLPIILCTGRGDKIEQFAALPLAAILSKPVFGKSLIEAVDRALTQKAAA